MFPSQKHHRSGGSEEKNNIVVIPQFLLIVYIYTHIIITCHMVNPEVVVMLFFH